MDTVERLAAVEAIRQAVARSARGVDRLERGADEERLWPEANDDHGVYVGNAMAFCDRVVETHARFDATMHCNMNHAIELANDGRTAWGEIYNTTLLFRRDDHGTPVVNQWWGRYLDSYEQRDGDWRIIDRVCVHEATRTSPIDQAMPLDAAQVRQGSADRPLRN